MYVEHSCLWAQYWFGLYAIALILTLLSPTEEA